MSEVPANSVGGGHIAAVGVGPQGEPPVSINKKKKPLKRFMSFKQFVKSENES